MKRIIFLALVQFSMCTACFENVYASTQCKDLLEDISGSTLSSKTEGPLSVAAAENSNSPIGLSTYDEAKTPGEIIAIVNNEVRRLQSSLEKTKRINSWYNARNWFRERLGAGARREESKIAAKLLRLKEAVRKGDYIETWKILDKPFLKTETAFLWTYKLRLQIVALEKKLQQELDTSSMGASETNAGIKSLRNQIKVSKQKLKTHLKTFINSYKEYKALRLFLEYEARNPQQGRQDFAQAIFKKVGLDHHGLKQYEGIRELVAETFPKGIPLQVMSDEIIGENYDSETERPLKDFGRMYSLRSQTIWLGLTYGIDVVSILSPNLTKIFEGFAQGAQKIPKIGPFIAPVFEIFTLAINDIEAVRYHLMDILTIESVYSKERPDQLASVMSEKGNTRSMVFLTNMARSFEHKMLLWEINARIALEGVGESHRLEQFLLDRTVVEDLRIEISILQKDLERIRNGINISGEPLNPNSDSEAEIREKLQEKIAALRDLESEVAKSDTEDETSKMAFNKNLEEINNIIEDRLDRLLNPKRSSSQPVGQYALMIKIRQAQERAIEMAPLSYSISTGTIVRNAAFNTALYFAVGYFILWSDIVPDDVERAFIDAVMPDMLVR